MSRVQGLASCPHAVVYRMHGLNKKKGREPFVHKSLPREGPLPTSNTQSTGDNVV